VIVYLLSDSFAEISLITIALLLNLPLPILPVQILWINLIDDGLPTLAMTVEPGEDEVIFDKPRKKNDPVINKEIKLLIFIISVVINIVSFSLFFWLLKTTDNIDYIRTMMFTTLAIETLFYAFSVRTLRQSLFTKNFFSNKYLIFSVIGGILLQGVAIYHPYMQKIFHTVSLGLRDWAIVIFLSLIVVFSIEIIKHFLIVKRVQRIPQKGAID